MIIEKMFRVNKPLFIAFVDLKKVFDNVNWIKLFKTMENIGIDYNDRKIISNIYVNKIAVIKTEKDNNQENVRQGFNYLFITYLI